MRELLIWISITLCSTTHLLPPLASWRISIHTPKCYTDYEPSILQSKDKITHFLFLNDIFYFCGTFNVLTFYDSDGSELIPIQFLSGGNVLIPNLNFIFFFLVAFSHKMKKKCLKIVAPAQISLTNASHIPWQKIHYKNINRSFLAYFPFNFFSAYNLASLNQCCAAVLHIRGKCAVRMRVTSWTY